MNDLALTAGLSLAAATNLGIGYFVGKRLGSRNQTEFADQATNNLSHHVARFSGDLDDARQELLAGPNAETLARIIADLLCSQTRLATELLEVRRQLDSRKENHTGAAPPERSQRVRIDEPSCEGPEGRENLVQPMSEPGDRRGATRFPLSGKVRIAPYDSGQLPPLGGFLSFDGWDISSTGFSFVSPRRPNFETLIVAIGKGEAVKFLTARVVRVVPHNLPDECIVGCEFTGRMHADLFA